MARKQTLVQLNEELLAVLDQRAARDGRSRSDVIRQAVEHFLAYDRSVAIGRQIAEAYTLQPDDDFDYTESAKRLIADEPW